MSGEGQRTLLGRYALVERLGSGGHGVVFLARDLLTEVLVAAKVLPESAEDEWVRRELSALRLLRLPGVVELLDSGSDGAATVVVMTYVRGVPFPGEVGPVPWARLAPKVHALLEIVNRIHAAGVFHRDLKPGNVFIDADQAVQVLDFGVSGGAALRTRRLAEDGILVGTPAYLAPEQMFGASHDARSDLYAVAVMIVEALTGVAPAFELSTSLSLDAPARRSALSAVGAPVEVAEVLVQTLSPTPEARPASALELLALLGGVTPMAQIVARLGAAELSSERALRGLFEGPERLFHLREDAARELWARAGADRARVAEQLLAWSRSGVASWRGDHLRLERGAIDRLRAERDPTLAPSPAHADVGEEQLTARTEQALAEGTPRAVNLALYELGRADVWSEHTRRLERLLLAARAAIDGEGSRALELLGAAAGSPWPARLEELRQGVRALAAHRGPASGEAPIVAELGAWADGVGTRRARRLHLEWLGRLRYREGRFAEAATVHEEEAATADEPVVRLGAMLRSASASMEAFQLERAQVLASALGALARERRLVLFEARAEWLLRATAYRAERALEVDEELLDAIEHLGVLQLGGLIGLNEAAVAWRCGRRETARAIAERAAARWRASSTPPGADLARALAILCGATCAEGEVAAMVTRALGSPIPSVSVQTLGVLLRAGVVELEAVADQGRDRAAVNVLSRLADGVPRSCWRTRMEVLSIDEALEAAAPRTAPPT